MAVATPRRAQSGSKPGASLGRLAARDGTRAGGLAHDAATIAQHIREGRFQRSLALIAGAASIFGGLEVLTEHYRGSYSQRVMYTPIVLSPALTIAGVWSVFSRRVARTLLPLTSVALLLDGALGFFFHVRGVQRKPGGWRIPVFNVVMGPPVFAPLLLGVSGFLGLVASLLRREDDLTSPIAASGGVRGWLRLLPGQLAREGQTAEQDIREGRFQQGLAVAAALTAFFNGIEALYSHYKNNFKYKSQWTPVLLAPVVIVAGFGAARSRTLARTLLPLASLLAIADGAIGFLYHLRGVLALPGRAAPGRLLYNVTYGPPVFAPLLFAATGFLGVLASLLRRAR